MTSNKCFILKENLTSARVFFVSYNFNLKFSNANTVISNFNLGYLTGSNWPMLTRTMMKNSHMYCTKFFRLEISNSTVRSELYGKPRNRPKKFGLNPCCFWSALISIGFDRIWCNTTVVRQINVQDAPDPYRLLKFSLN